MDRSLTQLSAASSDPPSELRRGLIPGHVAAEQEAEHEDEEADAQDDDVDVEGQVEELLRRHDAEKAEDLKHTTSHQCWITDSSSQAGCQ